MIKNYTVYVMNSNSQHFSFPFKANNSNGIGEIVKIADKLLLEKLDERPEPLHRAIKQGKKVIWSV